MSGVSLARRVLSRSRVVVAAGVVAGSLVAASGAQAAVPTGDYADFKNCPFGAKNLVACLYSNTNAGSIKLGNANVPINKSLILQGGVAQDPNTFATTFVNAQGAPTLSSTPLDVPGGLLGLMDTRDFGFPLLALFNQAVNAANGVTATAQLVGPVGYDFDAFAFRSGAAVTLPLRLKLDNPFLGPNCYIGSSSSPVTLRLTTGTTNPPRPNTPITGSYGQLDFANQGQLIKSTGYKLVDNSFSAPKASGCGYLPIDQFLITGAVNLKEGLPAAAGKNTAILQGNLKQADVAAVNASKR